MLEKSQYTIITETTNHRCVWCSPIMRIIKHRSILAYNHHQHIKHILCNISSLKQGAFLNVEEGSSRATISRMLRHRVPPKVLSNVQDAWNSTEAGTCVSSAVLKSPQCFAHGPISQICGGKCKAGPLIWRTPAHLLACSILSSPNARKDSCLASEGPDSEVHVLPRSLLDIEKHPECRVAVSDCISNMWSVIELTSLLWGEMKKDALNWEGRSSADRHQYLVMSFL